MKLKNNTITVRVCHCFPQKTSKNSKSKEKTIHFWRLDFTTLFDFKKVVDWSTPIMRRCGCAVFMYGRVYSISYPGWVEYLC